MTLLQVSVLQVFITARVQMGEINHGTTLSMFLTLSLSITCASLEPKENFKVAVNLFIFFLFAFLSLVNSLNL